MEILHVKPGHYFVFAETEAAFEEQWQRSQKAGELMEVLACTDDRPASAGGRFGPVHARTIKLNPGTIESAEPFTGSSRWLGDKGEFYAALLAAWEASRPPEEQKAKAAKAAQRAEDAKARERRRGEGFERRLNILADELADRGLEHVTVHRDGNPATFEGWIVKKWDDRRKVSDGIGYSAATYETTTYGMCILRDGIPMRVRLEPITVAPSLLTLLAHKVIGGPKHGGPRPRVVGHRWEIDAAYDLASSDPKSPYSRATVSSAVSEYCAGHGLKTDLSSPLPD
jgi:hypothetical protein